MIQSSKARVFACILLHPVHDSMLVGQASQPACKAYVSCTPPYSNLLCSSTQQTCSTSGKWFAVIRLCCCSSNRNSIAADEKPEAWQYAQSLRHTVLHASVPVVPVDCNYIPAVSIQMTRSVFAWVAQSASQGQVSLERSLSYF